MEMVTDYLKKILFRLALAIGCIVVIILCFNELDSRDLFAANPLKNTPIRSVTLKNLIAGPKTWVSLGWFNWSMPSQKTLSEVTAKLPAPILKLAGQASPAGSLSASYSSGVATSSAATQSGTSTISAAVSTPSAGLVDPDQWQKIQQELSQVWDRAKTTAGALQTFIRTQLFAPARSGTANGTGSATVTIAPLEQRAIEYAKYMYCKETVMTYERLYPEVVSPKPAQ